MGIITSLEKGTAKAIADEAVAILSAHFKAKGISVKYNSGSFSSEVLNTKFSFCVQTNAQGKKVEGPEAADYDIRRKMYGLPERGTTFTTHHGTYTIAGWKSRSRKYPVLAKHVDGTMYKFSPEQVLKGLPK